MKKLVVLLFLNSCTIVNMSIYKCSCMVETKQDSIKWHKNLSPLEVAAEKARIETNKHFNLKFKE